MKGAASVVNAKPLPLRIVSAAGLPKLWLCPVWLHYVLLSCQNPPDRGVFAYETFPCQQTPSEGRGSVRGSLWEICSAPHASERQFVKVVCQCSAAPLMSVTPREVKGAHGSTKCWLIAIRWNSKRDECYDDRMIILCGKSFERK